MWNINVACPTTLPMVSGQKYELKVVLAIALDGGCGLHLETSLLTNHMKIHDNLRCLTLFLISKIGKTNDPYFRGITKVLGQ